MSQMRSCPNCRQPLTVWSTTCPACHSFVTPLDGGLPPPPSVPEVAGYEVLGALGEGGMGVVYRARHRALNRVVALKMTRTTQFLSSEERAGLLARFRSEAEALARLQSPHIVQVHDIGELGGQLYVALELVEGGTLAQKTGGKPQPPRESAALVEVLARAMEEVHQHHIVHRDLKPANILLSFSRDAQSSERSAPDAERSASASRLNDCIPKITDFGLAKQLDVPTQHTQSGSIVGTPSYMAPEQADPRRGPISPATDVYALGAILYELLTGRPPFLAATLFDTLSQVLGDEVVPPARLNRNCPPDLETIALKCLEKSPQRRYPSARELADELRRWLDGRPIKARPVGPAGRAWRWCKRNPVVAGLLALVVVVLAAGLAGVSWQWQETLAERTAAVAAGELAQEKALAEEREKTRAVRAEGKALKSLEREQEVRYRRNIALADHEWFRDNVTLSLKLLDECPDRLRGWEWNVLKRRAHRDLHTLHGHRGRVVALAYAPDGVLVTGGLDTTVRLWDARKGKELFTFRGHRAEVTGVAVAPDGKFIASVDSKGAVLVWDRKGKIERTFQHGTEAMGVCFDREGKTLITGGSGLSPRGKPALAVWGLASGEMVRSVEVGHPEPIFHLTLSPDGQRLATSSSRSTITLYDTANWKVLATIPGQVPRPTGALCFTPNSRWLAWGEVTGETFVWNITDPIEKKVLLGWSSDKVDSLSFSPDAALLAVGSSNRTVQLWPWQLMGSRSRDNTYLAFQPHIQERIVTLRGHRHWVHAVGFSPDGQTLASAAQDGEVKVWAPLAPANEAILTDKVDSVFCLAVSRDSRWVAYGNTTPKRDGTDEHVVALWNVARNKVEHSFDLPDFPSAVAFHPDGELLALAAGTPVIVVYNRKTRHVDYVKGHERGVRALGFSPDGKWLVSGGGGFGFMGMRGAREPGEVCLWRTGDWKKAPVKMLGHTGGVNGVAFSPDSKVIASGGVDSRVRLWAVPSGKSLATLDLKTELVTDVAFRPDGKELAVGCSDGRLVFWDVSAGAGKAKKGQEVLASGTTLLSIAYSPDGRRIATAGSSGSGLLAGEVRLWDRASGQQLIEFREVKRAQQVVRFSPDGRRLYFAGFGRIHVFDGSPLTK